MNQGVKIVNSNLFAGSPIYDTSLTVKSTSLLVENPNFASYCLASLLYRVSQKSVRLQEGRVLHKRTLFGTPYSLK